MTKARREYLKEGKMLEYRDSLTEMNSKEEVIMEEILQSVYKKLQISEEVFENSMYLYVKAHPVEIHQITKLTQKSMTELKNYYFDIEQPELPTLTDF